METPSDVTSFPDADNIRFDAKANLLYAGYGDGALVIIDATTLKKQEVSNLRLILNRFNWRRRGVVSS